MAHFLSAMISDSISCQLNMCLSDGCTDSRDDTTPEQSWGGAIFAIQDVKGVVFGETCLHLTNTGATLVTAEHGVATKVLKC